MKKIHFLLSFIFIATFTVSCEEDDICLGGEATPALTVVIMNAETNKRQADSLYIDLVDQNFENPIILYEGILSDSLKLPLGTLDQTSSYFKIKRKKNGVSDNLTVDYETKTSFVSKACGFKINYENVNYASTNNAIVNLESNSTVIENESAANLYIFYPN